MQWIMDSGEDTMSATAEVEDDGVHFAELVNLEVMIEKVSASTNEYLIRRLNEKYHLLDHCRALKSYLLLGQVCVCVSCTKLPRNRAIDTSAATNFSIRARLTG